VVPATPLGDQNRGTRIAQPSNSRSRITYRV